MSKTTYLGNNVYKHSVYGYRSDDRLKLDHGKDVSCPFIKNSV